MVKVITRQHHEHANRWRQSLPTQVSLISQEEMVRRIEAIRAEADDVAVPFPVLRSATVTVSPLWCRYCGGQFTPGDPRERYCSDACYDSGQRITLVRKTAAPYRQDRRVG